MTKIFMLTIALFCLSLWVGINVYAENTRPCADDIANFCKEVKQGGGRISQCLREHEKDLSPACKKWIEEKRKMAKEVHKACADDIDKLCKDVQPGKGNIAKCLKEHTDELSPECKEEFSKMKQKRGK